MKHRDSADTSGHPRQAVTRLQLFALAFGCIVGSSWVVLLGDWLNLAGPMGTILGFVAGGALMTLIAACYAELAARMPQTGGEFLYSLQIFGPRTAFFVGWFFTLCLLAVAVFEAISLAWILQMLFPQDEQLPLYTVGGEPITAFQIAVGLSGAVLFATLNYIGVKAAATFQSIITYGFLVVAGFAIVTGGIAGEARHLTPLWTTGSGQPWWHGSLWIFATCAGYLNGFQAVPQAIEERAPGISLREVGRIMVLAVISATVFYCAVVLCASLSRPWTELVGKELAAAAALEHVLPRGLLATMILAAAGLSVLKTWNAIVLMAARMIMAQARHGLLPVALSRLHPRFATPTLAVLLIGVVNAAGVFIGRAAVLPIVTMAAVCLVIALAVSCLGLIVLRRRQPAEQLAFRVPGGTISACVAFAASLLMAAVALLDAWMRSTSAIPVELLIMVAWAVIGMCFVAFGRRQPIVGTAGTCSDA